MWHATLVAASMWDLVPGPGMEPGPPALGVWSLYWTTREVPHLYILEWELPKKGSSTKVHKLSWFTPWCLSSIFVETILYFFMGIEVVFEIADVRHCHLTVTPIAHCSEKVTS